MPPVTLLLPLTIVLPHQRLDPADGLVVWVRPHQLVAEVMVAWPLVPAVDVRLIPLLAFVAQRVPYLLLLRTEPLRE